MDITLIIVIFFTLLASAFFSGMEIAFISSNRLKVELDIAKGTFKGKLLALFYNKESNFIALLLLGNNVALVVFGISAAAILDPVIKSWGVPDGALILLIQTILSTMLVLIVAEFLPKAIVQINPNFFLNITALPMVIVYIVLYLPTLVIVAISNVFLKLLRTENDQSTKVFSRIDLEHYVQELNGRLNEEEDLGNEMQILQNALDFSSIKARDCMIPRTEIIAMDLSKDVSDLHAVFTQTGLSKIIIYRENIDNIIGYVRSFDLFKKPEAIKQILMPIAFVPAAMSGKELLELFTKKSGNIAVVVDEYGGTDGLVTIEDVIEQIFGDIEDEHDIEDWLEEKISNKEYVFSGRIDIEYLNNEYGLKLPESEEFETLAGLIINELESIPEDKARVEIEDYTFIIEQVTDRRIETVRVIVK